MATIYKVKDGPQGNRTDLVTEITVTDLTTKLSNHKCRYLGKRPPHFNTSTPSEYYRHIVIEVTDDDELNNKFNKKGFYLINNVDASEADSLFKLNNSEI